MSMTVRYPNGLVVTYNDAQYLTRGGEWVLWTANPEKGGTQIAFIQAAAGAIVEFRPAYRAESSTLDLEKAARILSRGAGDLRSQPFAVLRDLKRELSGFNAKTGAWR